MRDEIQKKAFKIALEKGSGTLSLPVRTGKTLVGIRLICEFDKCLISYPNSSIKESWFSDADKFGISLANCTFTTHLSLNKHNLDEFDIVILDEIDQVSEAQWAYIADYPLVKLYGLTGTPPVEGSIKRKYLNTFCPIIYEVSLDETVGILQKDYEITVHMLEPSTKADILLKSGKYWSEKAKIQFWENKYKSSREFMDMLRIIQTIQNSPTKLAYLRELSTKLDRALIFVETKEQCENLKIPSYYSGNKLSGENLNDFQNGTVNKLACVKQLSAGISFKNLNKAIILHCYASNNKFHQRFGRILNLIDNIETKAEVHLLCLKETKDEKWVKDGLAELDQNKIKYINI